MRRLFVSCCVVLLLAALAASTALSYEIQLTTGTDRNHSLDNNLNWSPDCQWLAYDCRPFSGGLQLSRSIEKVNVDTKDIVVIHQVVDPETWGPGVAAVSFFPDGDTTIAIHGPETSTGLSYQGYRRFGAMVSPTDGSTNSYTIADARDVTNLTPGALRGGTHRHDPSGDGQWIGFTYNDMLMVNQGTDLRTIGVTKLGIPVDVDETGSGGENWDGAGFTVLVVKVKPQADITWGSDDIFKAESDSWVGENGYLKPDMTRQRARAFIGKTLTSTGGIRNEVFIVDIPEDITVEGPDGPLEGTATTFPMPPAGTVQRRLTTSATDCGGIIRCSLDGSRIAFTRDGQIQLISPNGGDPVQATSLANGTSNPWWDPSGKFIYSVNANSIWRTNVIEGDPDFGTSVMLTDPTLYPGRSPGNLVVSPDGKWIAFNRSLDRGDGVYVSQVFMTPTPEPSTFVLAALGLLGMLAFVRRRR